MSKMSFGIGLVSFALVACNVDSAILGAPSSSAPPADKSGIVMTGASIAFDGNKVQLGQSLATWKKTVPGTPRCTSERVSPVMCTWDQLGLQVGTDDGLKNVEFASLFLVRHQADTEPLPPRPDGSPARVSTVTPRPEKPFSGRLQLDGVEITPKTQFSKVRASIDQSRNVRCRLHDCSLPHGSFGNGTQIFFELNGRSEADTIVRIGFAHASEHR